MRKLQFEALEKKVLLAGDVSVAVNGTTLEVQGDREGNVIGVSDDGTNLVFQSIPNSSTTTFNGGQSSVTIPKAGIDLLMADLGTGPDLLAFTGVDVKMDIQIDTGHGAAGGPDTVAFNLSSIVGDVKVVGSDFGDRFRIARSAVDGNLDVRLGSYHDVADLRHSSVTGNIFVDAGQGGHAADILFFASMTVGGNVSLLGGQGRDVVLLGGILTIDGDFTADGGLGNKDGFRDSSTLVVGGNTSITGFEIFA